MSWVAPPLEIKLQRRRDSGSGWGMDQQGWSSEAQTRLGLRFVPFPGPSSSVKKDKTYTCLSMMRCLASPVAATYRLPAARLSGCTTGTPSQADVDCPEPQEVLVSKEACLQFCR